MKSKLKDKLEAWLLRKLIGKRSVMYNLHIIGHEIYPKTEWKFIMDNIVENNSSESLQIHLQPRP